MEGPHPGSAPEDLPGREEGRPGDLLRADLRGSPRRHEAVHRQVQEEGRPPAARPQAAQGRRLLHQSEHVTLCYAVSHAF